MNRNLLQDRRFRPHFWTQFFGALNDNVFKNALVILITFKAFSIAGIPTEQMVAICGGIFILPFFLFSATAGQLADKYSKSQLIIWIKIWEIIVMLMGAYGFITENIIILIMTLFLMGLQSTFFGPVKYSILPHLLGDDELVSGNAYVELGTFIAILFGTILGGILIAIPHHGVWMVSAAVIIFAAIGCISSVKIRKLKAVTPSLKFRFNPIPQTLLILKLMKKRRSVFLSVLGISWFWFLGAVILSMLPIYCKNSLNSNESVVTFFLALFSIGVGTGSVLCERLSFRKLELGLVPIGSIGLSLFSFDLFLIGQPYLIEIHPASQISVLELISTWTGFRISLDLFLFSVFSGLFIVPLYTLIQQRSIENERSRVIAANNILNALFMVVSAIFLMMLFYLKLTIPQIFLVLSIINALVAVYIYTIIPEFLFRLMCWFVAHILYRIQVIGRENIPSKGPAVLICNHVSFVDWLIIASACPRPIRFVMHYSFLEIPLTGRIFKDARVIPIAGSKESPEILNSALENISEELGKDELVCIFPEGTITGDGNLGTFKPGIERIIQKTPVPVIPLALTGLWGSFFSRKYGKAMSKPFRRCWSRITLNIGSSVSPAAVSAEKLCVFVKQLTLDSK